jgi:biotin synthase
MRRVRLPKSPLLQHGIITELRLAQVTAVVLLSTIGNERLRSVAVHEPNTLGLCSGANAVYAEAGANPRDLDEATQRSRGHSVPDCEQMLLECGYTATNNGNFEAVELPELE